MVKQGEGPAVLIAALSGRALAACARRGGYRPLVADLFLDQDTLALTEASERVPGSLGRGFDPPSLLAALDRLATGRPVIGVVPGTGFEDRPAVLAAVAARYRLLGNTPEVVVAIKDPTSFAALCATSGVPHPDIRFELPGEGKWLRKRVGGMGGAHIVGSPTRPLAGSGQYYQRLVSGTPVSVAFLAAQRSCRILALTKQWVDPVSQRPFRYGGAVRPAVVAPSRAAELKAAVARIVSNSNLCGLNSADFMVRDDGIDLLEINPRPGATLDLLADADGQLFRWHVEACAGILPDRGPAWARPAAASAILHARANLTVPPGFRWPDWAADRTPPASFVPRGQPLCSVIAEADDPVAAERLVRERAAGLLELVSPPPGRGAVWALSRGDGAGTLGPTTREKTP